MNADEIVRTIRIYAAGDLLLHHHELMPRANAVADLIESLQAQLEQKTNEAEGMRSNWYKCIENLKESQRRADAAVECIEKIDDWNNHFCYHDLEEIIDEWRGVKEERK